MRWTEGVGHSARPYNNTWKPYSQSLDTLGSRRRHMPWGRAPGRDTQQPFDGCGSTVGNSLGQAHARFWIWRSGKWWRRPFQRRKKGGQASGMWRSGHGQSGGYCSFGKSDESNTGVPTCPFLSRTRRDYRQDGKGLLEARTSKGTGGMHCVGVGRRSYGAPASRRSCSQEGGSLPVSPRITATRRTCGPAKDGCTSRFRWTGGGGGRAERSSTGQKNDLGTVCGQDGSEQICKTLHLSDALGLRRVRSAQRDGKEANPWSPRVPRAQSTTASPAAKENTGSWSVTGDVFGGFGGQLERLMRLPDVPRKQEGLVAGGLMALGRLAATIDPRRGLARLTQAL